MGTATWVLRGALFVALLGSVNLAFTGRPVMGVVAVVAVVSVYLSLRSAQERAS